MAAETQYTANTGMATISTANSNLDGTGDIIDVITGASNGTLIRTVTIIASQSTTKGVIRLFVDDTKNSYLLKEIEVDAITVAATVPAFEKTILLNFKLEATWVLKASTEKGETFNIIAEGLNWTYYAASVRAETTQFAHCSTAVTIATANSNRDGSGTMGTVLVSSGINLIAITIKALQTTTEGMVRLFLYNNSTGQTRLFKEIPIGAVTASATQPSFYYKLVFEDFFALKSGWYLKASTQNAESFSVIPEALNWSYPA